MQRESQRPPAQQERARQPAERAPPAQSRSPSEALAKDSDARATTKAKSQIKAEAAVVTAGRAGERNITVQWIDVWIGNAKPCRFDVATQPGHGLEVIVEQGHYRKTYTGIGALSTQPVPVAPIGTKFKLRVTDTTTGEILDQNGIWYDMSGSLWSALWGWLKRQLWKG